MTSCLGERFPGETTVATLITVVSSHKTDKLHTDSPPKRARCSKQGIFPRWATRNDGRNNWFVNRRVWVTVHIMEGGTLPVRSVFLCLFFFTNFNPMCVSFTSACCALFDVKLMEFQELRKARRKARRWNVKWWIDELMYFRVKLSYPEWSLHLG